MVFYFFFGLYSLKTNFLAFGSFPFRFDALDVELVDVPKMSVFSDPRH